MKRRGLVLVSNAAVANPTADPVLLVYEGSEDVYRAFNTLGMFSFSRADKARALGLNPRSPFLGITPREQRDVILRLARNRTGNDVVVRAQMIDEIRVLLEHRFGRKNVEEHVYWMLETNEVFRRRTLYEMMTSYLLFMRHAIRLLRGSIAPN